MLDRFELFIEVAHEHLCAEGQLPPPPHILNWITRIGERHVEGNDINYPRISDPHPYVLFKNRVNYLILTLELVAVTKMNSDVLTSPCRILLTSKRTKCLSWTSNHLSVLFFDSFFSLLLQNNDITLTNLPIIVSLSWNCNAQKPGRQVFEDDFIGVRAKTLKEQFLSKSRQFLQMNTMSGRQLAFELSLPWSLWRPNRRMGCRLPKITQPPVTSCFC